MPSLSIKQETSLPGVYAVGDCATIYDNARGEMSCIALASNAVRSGIVGAYNATGHGVEGIGVQGSNGISIYGLHMVPTGLTLERSKSCRLQYPLKRASMRPSKTRIYQTR